MSRRSRRKSRTMSPGGPGFPTARPEDPGKPIEGIEIVEVNEAEEKRPDPSSVYSVRAAAEREAEVFGRSYLPSDFKTEGQNLEQRGFEFLWEFFNRVCGERQGLLNLWKRQWQLFNVIHAGVEAREYGSQIEMPTGFEAVYTPLGFIYESAYPPEWLRVGALNDNYRMQAKHAQALFEHNFRVQRWPLALKDAILLSLIHGIAPIQLQWSRDIRKIKHVEDDSDELAERKPWERVGAKIRAKAIKIRDIIIEGARLNVLAPHDYYQLGTTTDPQRCPGVGIREVIERPSFAAMERTGHLIPGSLDRCSREVKSLGQNGNALDLSPFSEWQGGQIGGGSWDSMVWEWEHEVSREIAAGLDPYGWGPQSSRNRHISQFTPRRYYGQFPLRSWDEWTECDVMFVGPLMVRCKETFLERPVVVQRANAIPGFLYGLGNITPIETLVDAINQMANNYADLADLQVSPPIKIADSAGLPSGPLDAGAGAQWRMRDVSMVEWGSPPTDIGAALNAIGFWTNTYKGALGHTPALLGVSSGQRETGTQRVSDTEQSSARTRMEGLCLQYEVQQPLAEMTVHWQQLFLSTEHHVLVLGDDGMKHPMALDRDAIVGKFYFEITPATATADKGVLVNQMRGIMTESANLAAIYPDIVGGVDWLGLARDIAIMTNPKLGKYYRQATDDQAAPGEPMRELRVYMNGGETKPKPGPENIGFVEFYDQPTGNLLPDGTPMTVWQWMLWGNHATPDVNRYRFALCYQNRKMLAQAEFMKAIQMQNQQRIVALQGGGGQGGAQPAPGRGQKPGGVGKPPQERSSSETAGPQDPVGRTRAVAQKVAHFQKSLTGTDGY